MRFLCRLLKGITSHGEERISFGVGRMFLVKERTFFDVGRNRVAEEMA